MLPQVLNQLIAEFQDHNNGIFIYSKNNIWWFNGKRFENWGLTLWNIDNFENDRCCYFLKKKLYVYNGNQIFVSNGKKNDQSKKKIPIENFSCCYCLDENNNCYELFMGLLTKNKMLVKRKQWVNFGRSIFYYKNYIYCFSYNEKPKNEKYSIEENNWLNISSPNFVGEADKFYLLNNLFYRIDEYFKIQIYNPQFDQWSHCKLKIPK
jgi:hypothetical protein